MPPAYKELRKEMAERVRSGEYLLGDLVEGKKYTRLVLVDGEIIRKEFLIEARRIPMEEIRVRIFKEHQELGLKSF